jgi:hypothetical protein
MQAWMMGLPDQGEMRMRCQYLSVVCLASLLAFTSMAEAKKMSSTPAGTKVASGKQFDIFVVLKESKPWAGTNLVLNIYATTVVVHHTRKHGRQLFKSRLEAVDTDLLDSSMWQVGDFNGDGFEDYRAVSGRDKKGCSTWQTQTWLPDRERFTFAAKITYLTDASGKEVKTCYPRKRNQ